MLAQPVADKSPIGLKTKGKKENYACTLFYE